MNSNKMLFGNYINKFFIMQKQIAQILLDLNAVQIKTNPPFTWTSGLKSPIYCDNRLLFSDVEARRKITAGFIKLVEELEFDVIAGTATAGIPWASFLAEELDMPLIYIRGESKKHGKQNQIEGYLQKGQKVLIIEDLISTGKSSIAAAEAVRKAGGKVKDVAAIFTYELLQGIEAFAQADLRFHTLTDFPTLISITTLSNDEKQNVLEFANNPQKWGK